MIKRKLLPLMGIYLGLLVACGQSEPGIEPVPSNGLCEAPLRLCGDDCVSVDNDPNHCGACDTACDPGSFCDKGACTAVCSSDLAECGGACADLQTDRAHCGQCGEACATDRMCIGGSCVCPPGTEDCSGECTDIQSAVAHCGQCNMACESDEICSASSCVCRTGTRETNCTDGQDDDCDGLVDCLDPDCEGATRRCNGACGAGVETCERASWGACVGGSGEAEICGDGVDQDCQDGDLRSPDTWEPNDDCSQCRLIQPGDDPDRFIEARFDSVDDRVDCYRFNADDGVSYRETIRLKLENIPVGHDYDLYLYQGLSACQNQDSLALSISTSNADENIEWGEAFGTSDSGTYFIRVVRFVGYSCTDDYKLTIDGLN